MARRSDCIFCGADTGSREHTFPAGLGGRRMNKGILCGACNEGFSSLDALLIEQLRPINGLIGTRPDRHDFPKPAIVPSSEGLLAIDSSGTPSYAEPVTLKEEVLPDGRKIVQTRFANEQQVQQWNAQQRKAGFEPKVINRQEGTRYTDDKIEVAWTFGGSEAFREIGRIALNFLAHHWPDLARADELAPFKAFVLGNAEPGEGDPRFVWYAPSDEAALPAPSFEFGHQVLVGRSAEHGVAFARVRFFSAFDLCVWFGRIACANTEHVLVDIDPLAEHPPNDIRTARLDSFPALVQPQTYATTDLGSVHGSRLEDLLQRVADLQWRNGTVGLLDAINEARPLSRARRIESIHASLTPHKARALRLARAVADRFRSEAAKPTGSDTDSDLATYAQMFDAILAPDPARPNGLSEVASETLDHAHLGLATAIADELEAAPFHDEQLRRFLDGGHGMHAVGATLSKLIARILAEPGDEADEPCPPSRSFPESARDSVGYGRGRA